MTTTYCPRCGGDDGTINGECVRCGYTGEPAPDPDSYDRNGAFDGFQVVSDAEGGL